MEILLFALILGALASGKAADTTDPATDPATEKAPASGGTATSPPSLTAQTAGGQKKQKPAGGFKEHVTKPADVLTDTASVEAGKSISAQTPRASSPAHNRTVGEIINTFRKETKDGTSQAAYDATDAAQRTSSADVADYLKKTQLLPSFKFVSDPQAADGDAQ